MTKKWKSTLPSEKLQAQSRQTFDPHFLASGWKETLSWCLEPINPIYCEDHITPQGFKLQ